jgi:hypothetical protein
MTIEQIRRLHQAQPFQPFEIYVADGRSFEVNHPELMAVHGLGRTIAVGVPNGSFEILDLLLVTSLKPRANGAAKRHRR